MSFKQVVSRSSMVVILAMGLVSLDASAFCFKEAAARYHIEEGFLRAVAKTESSMNPRAHSPANAIGLMQIHESWFPKLRREFGLSVQDVWEPCTNVMIGAWILANEFAKRGKNWNAVGAYNASCTRLKGIECQKQRQRYSMSVYKNWISGGRTQYDRANFDTKESI